MTVKPAEKGSGTPVNLASVSPSVRASVRPSGGLWTRFARLFVLGALGPHCAGGVEEVCVKEMRVEV